MKNVAVFMQMSPFEGAIAPKPIRVIVWSCLQRGGLQFPLLKQNYVHTW